MVRAEARERGGAAFALSMPFDEVAVLRQNIAFLESTLSSVGIQSVHVFAGDSEPPQPEVAATAVPGKPAAHPFYSEQAASAPSAAAPPTTKEMLDYLSQHSVGAVLNQAVNELASEQPADPFAWLSAWLAKAGSASPHHP